MLILTLISIQYTADGNLCCVFGETH